MVLKFLHLQSHFIHLYLLTIFEVFFYIYYIMPYEKTIFNHIFDGDISYIPKINTTYIPLQNCNEYQNDLDENNEKLWNSCFIYIVTSSSIFVAVFFRDLWKNYSAYNVITTIPSSPRYDPKSAIVSFGSFQNLNDYKKTDDKKMDDKEASIEMISSPKNTENNSSVLIENPTFIKYYWYSSGFLKEFIKTLEFILLVGIFEYLFFVYIVNKYKIANSKTILCNIYKKIK